MTDQDFTEAKAELERLWQAQKALKQPYDEAVSKWANLREWIEREKLRREILKEVCSEEYLKQRAKALT